MARLVAVAATLLVLLGAAPAVAAPPGVLVEELITDEAGFSGQEITVVGELIGDYGRRRDGTVWTQLNGDSYVFAPLLEGGDLSGSNTGIGVRIPGELVDPLERPGGYRRRGPVVMATGVWRYHDDGRSGESYLDVFDLAVVEPGRELSDTVPWWAVVAGLVMIAAGVAQRARTTAASDPGRTRRRFRGRSGPGEAA